MTKYSLPLSFMYKTENPRQIAMDKKVFEDMMLQLRADEDRPDCPEKGGILGCSTNGEITHFFFDRNAVADPVSYCPDGACLERVIRIWKTQNIRFVGLIHTHTREDALHLSQKDLRFVARMLTINPGMEMIMAILAKGGKLVLYKFEPDFLKWTDKEAQK